ncbi:hypothetical protein MXD61_18560 [Frankia sp. AgPm24]|uniref:hypothetical protein n=1 Tax=Frankia sp. AgPm24 TaxID=631128 RepID=UPI002010651B|nr:hypothetical protein [Frankia sp. AgPm24]MCK9923844.1 hypothetical protein [Frankia sp. AgPm24]
MALNPAGRCGPAGRTTRTVPPQTSSTRPRPELPCAPANSSRGLVRGSSPLAASGVVPGDAHRRDDPVVVDLGVVVRLEVGDLDLPAHIGERAAGGGEDLDSDRPLPGHAVDRPGAVQFEERAHRTEARGVLERHRRGPPDGDRAVLGDLQGLDRLDRHTPGPRDDRSFGPQR